jgi:cellulose 1,4-beta-cellobiosidase
VIDTNPSPACGLAPLDVTFTGSDLAGSGGTFSWTIDGVDAGSGTELSHTFTADGQYVVRLTIDNGPLSDSTEVTVKVPC